MAIAPCPNWFAQGGTPADGYNSVILVCAKTGNVQRAEHWLQQMITAGRTPDEVSYASVINACAEKGVASEWKSR